MSVTKLVREQDNVIEELKEQAIKLEEIIVKQPLTPESSKDSLEVP